MDPDRERWNRKYSGGRAEAANPYLIMYQDRLARGTALDIAAGPGENAAILALAGWTVVACDIADEAVKRAKIRSRELKAAMSIVQGQADRLPFRAGRFNTVVVSWFHDPKLAAIAPSLLLPGGTLFYQAFTVDHRKHHPAFPAEYCLKPGEIPTLFKLEPVLHREVDENGRAFALFIGRK